MDKIVNITYKFLIYTNKELNDKLCLFSSYCRKVYNLFNEILLDHYKNNLSIYSLTWCEHILSEFKKFDEYAYLKEPYSQSLQFTLRTLIDTWFKHLKDPKNVGIPKFKKKNYDYPQIVYPQPEYLKLDKLNNGKIHLPKIGWIRFKQTRPIEGELKQVKLVYNEGKWFICLSCEITKLTISTIDKPNIGLDLGVAHFITDNNGNYYDLPNINFEEYGRRIGLLQTKLQNKQEGSKGYIKLKNYIARIYKHVRNKVNDFLNKLSTRIVNSHKYIVVEGLNVGNMVNKEKKKSNKTLRKRILQQGWSKFKNMLKYKAYWYTTRILPTYIEIDPAYTSQTCSKCGYKDKANRKSQSEFICKSCGIELNADHNAAINILNKAPTWTRAFR